MSSDSALLFGLPPILDANVETLILGSFPSPASLAAGQYYAHRQNQFWRIMAEITGELLHELDYMQRCHRVLAHRIGIWDIYQSCQRKGALDAAIREAIPNDFECLKTEAPHLRCIGFNGKTAGRFELSFREAAGYSVCVLPSTSPAYTLPFEHKLERWRAGLSVSDEGRGVISLV